MRTGELREIKIEHLSVHEAKMDKLREGETIYISKLPQDRCPVDIQIQMRKLGDDPHNYLISRLAKTKKGHKAMEKYQISYNRIRENFKDMISTVSNGTFCLHSLRSGVASAASEYGVTDRLIGKHGRWS